MALLTHHLACRSLDFDVSAEEGRVGEQTQTFRCDGAGVRVSFQAKEIAGELYRVKPAVCSECVGLCTLAQMPLCTVHADLRLLLLLRNK